MNIRLYSVPVFGGAPNVGVSMWVSYVSAVGGGGGDVIASTIEYDTTDPTGFMGPVMRGPNPEEIFTVISPDGSDVDSLVSGQQICLRTSDGHFVGIDHDEENREDSIVASAVSPGIGEIFTITIMILPSLTTPSLTLDPNGPSFAVAFMGRVGYLAFPQSTDGPLDIGSSVLGPQQTFALDLLDPGRFHRRIPKVKHRGDLGRG